MSFEFSIKSATHLWFSVCFGSFSDTFWKFIIEYHIEPITIYLITTNHHVNQSLSQNEDALFREFTVGHVGLDGTTVATDWGRCLQEVEETQTQTLWSTVLSSPGLQAATEALLSAARVPTAATAEARLLPRRRRVSFDHSYSCTWMSSFSVSNLTLNTCQILFANIWSLYWINITRY